MYITKHTSSNIQMQRTTKKTLKAMVKDSYRYLVSFHFGANLEIVDFKGCFRKDLIEASFIL